MDPTLETTGPNVGQQLMADRVDPTAGTDHGDRLREQSRTYAEGFCTVLSRQPDRLGLLSRLDRESDSYHAVIEVVVDLIPGLGEDLDHLAVLWQDIGHELGHASLLADRGQMLEQH